jgi:predicted RNase H-like nuclease (RuvC/YqgF family)
MTDEELRMEAYYYGFDKTGQIEIDRILSAVACAGKAFHHTNDWNDEATPRTFHEGATPIDWIQNRAKEAADTIEALRAENAKLKTEMEELRKSKMGRLAWYKMRDEEERAAMEGDKSAKRVYKKEKEITSG